MWRLSVVKPRQLHSTHDCCTYEQIEHLKFIRIASEFSRLVLDVSSKNRVQLNRNPNVRVEMAVVGYSQIVDIDAMSLELYNKLIQVQKFGHSRDVRKFFTHTLAI
jgi:hypothetical protein